MPAPIVTALTQHEFGITLSGELQMTTIYHQGEVQIQERTGARALAARLERTVTPGIAHKFIDFIQSQPLLVLSTIDSQGRPWATMLCREPGFMTVMDEQTLHIDALPAEGDPLYNNLQAGQDVGLLLIDFATRRRLRVNGKMSHAPKGFSVQTRQVYANCPRYIQARKWQQVEEVDRKVPVVKKAATFNDAHQQWIAQADTFFIASYHPTGGADASHRGGFAGFVQMVDEKTLVWPEYNGNGMFNSLGNITEHPATGLLFVDFEDGATLQLTGSAHIVWDEERIAAIPGAERLVEFNLDQALISTHAGRLRWRFVNYSPDNPWYC